MKRYRSHSFCAQTTIFLLAAALAAAAAQPVYSTFTAQQHPDIDYGVIVWAEEVDGFASVFGLDLSAPLDLIPVAAYDGSDQDLPSIWFDRVLFQENFEGDWDIYVADISDPANPVDFLVNSFYPDYLNDQTNPAIHGNTAVWQSYVIADDGEGGTIEHWDIYAADITEPNNAFVYVVNEDPFDQAAPAVYRTDIVYQDNTFGDEDILTADILLRNLINSEVISELEILNETAPAVAEDIVVYQQEETGGDMNIYARDMSVPDSEPFVIAGGAWNEQAPDISGHIVVWQDDRAGNWDIYAYNLITKTEFPVTTNSADQTEPAVTTYRTESDGSVSTVVWTDARELPTYPLQIYYSDLDPVDAADCPFPLSGDVNGDCRVDLSDYARIAENWLVCNRDPITACPN